jgi:hypothetical protein
MAQTGAVKALHRTPLEHRHLIPGLDLGAQVTGPPSFPDIKNPWYTAIWCRHSRWPGELRMIPPAMANGIRSLLSPDVIATNEGCLFPCLVDRRTADSEPRMELRPFLCSETEYVWSNIKDVGLGVAATHLLWAIEWIVLSEIPWNSMMSSYLRTAELTWQASQS